MSRPGDTVSPLLDQALLLFSTLETVRSVALIGSRARGAADALSDVDLLILTAKAVPHGSERLRQYRDASLGEAILIDRRAGDAHHDVLRNGDAVFDLYWLPVATADLVLAELSRDFDRDEALAAALATAEPLYDPDDTLGRLRRSLPPYPVQRGIHRVRHALQEAQREFFDLRRLETAAFRADALAFQRIRCELIDTLLSCLHALNRVWLDGGDRFLGRFGGWSLLPRDAAGRVEELVLHWGSCADLSGAYDALLALFAETAALARQAYPEALFPTAWE